MSEKPHPLDGRLEPEARDVSDSVDAAALVSIAVSLKRIADALPQDGLNFAALDTMAWQIGQTLGRGFEIGSRR